MSNQELDLDAVERHVQTVPNLSIQPTKLPEAEKISKENIKGMTKAYWDGRGASLSDAFEMGRMLANTKDLKENTDIFSLLADPIIQGIKKANMKASVPNEDLRDHFTLLITVLKMIGDDLNAVYTPGSGGKKGEYQAEPAIARPKFDIDELLATLNGFITAKIYG